MFVLPYTNFNFKYYCWEKMTMMKMFMDWIAFAMLAPITHTQIRITLSEMVCSFARWAGIPHKRGYPQYASFETNLNKCNGWACISSKNWQLFGTKCRNERKAWQNSTRVILFGSWGNTKRTLIMDILALSTHSNFCALKLVTTIHMRCHV